jgi:hypothetical protein
MAGTMTTAAAAALCALLMNATTWDDYAEDDTTTPLANFQLSLHTADPTVTGNQTSSEAAYGSYAREAVARTSGGWTCSSNVANLTSEVPFTQSTSGSETETYMGIGRASTGTGDLDWRGALSPTISVSGSGVTPRLGTGTTVTFS